LAFRFGERTGDTALYAEKRTSGFDAIRCNCLRENPRLRDDGTRGKSPLRYDVASDAGVGAKSGPDDANSGLTKSDFKRWAPGNYGYWQQNTCPRNGGGINWGYQPLINPGTFGGTSYGANIIFRYNGNPKGLNWRQVISVDGGQFTQDCNPGGCPNYYSADQLAQSNVSGPNFLTFLDQPSALPGNVTFNAQTSLVSQSSGAALITISWGYQLNGTAITLVPLTYFYPSN
jgi:hypothetical protein